jgi:PPOX class probable F420-dependent enzyme
LRDVALADEKYVSFTTYRRNGTPVATPVWWVSIAAEGGAERFGFWTSSATGKVKRLRTDPKVLVQPSDGRGRVKPGTSPVGATAELVTEGPDFEAVTAAVKAEHGVLTSITRFLAKANGFIKRKAIPYADVCVVVVPDPRP